MKIAFFNSKPYDLEFFNLVNAKHGHIINYYPTHLTLESVALIKDETVVCAFINDCLDEDVLHALKKKGIELIALRSAGFNHVDLVCAKQLSLPVVRVSSYSPYAIAEHAVGLLQCLNRRIHRAYNRVREGDFSLHNLIGFDLHGKTVGVVGTGNIGQAFIRIMLGFGCKVLAFDPIENDECIKSGVQYVPLDTLFKQSDIISLHCPLTPQTHHLIDSEAIALMKDDVTIINTSRGKLIDTKAIIQALKLSKIGLLGLDVYEEEEDIFFEDLSSTVLQDDQLSRLLTFPNVIITSHQAFFTKEAMLKIAQVTLSNISRFEHNGILENEVVA
jgi:D-lactate dehydrogenase